MTIANLQVIILFHKSFSCYLHFFWRNLKKMYICRRLLAHFCQDIGIQTLWSYLDGIGKWDGAAGKTY